MKKIFDFGKIDYDRKGRPANRVTIAVEYKKNNNGQLVFSASGDIWNARETDILYGGQCLDTIAEHINTPLFQEIYRLWKIYHHNDMHPECEHQAAEGWSEKASKKITLYHWCMTQDTIKEQKAAEKAAISALKAGESFTPTEQQTFFANLPYSLTTHTDTPPANIAKYYKPKKPLYVGDKGHTETKMLGWLRESEHPEGILSKACPVCGYKYGSAWVYHPIPENDHQAILALFEEV